MCVITNSFSVESELLVTKSGSGKIGLEVIAIIQKINEDARNRVVVVDMDKSGWIGDIFEQ